jgi:small subunit ribosomal protein S19e
MNFNEYEGTELVKAIAKDMKQMPEFTAPEWTMFVKTGLSRQRPPVETDWWYSRVASILRKVAILGPIGVSKLRRKYGGKYRRGYAPAIFVKGSGKIIRVALQQLEKSGMIKQAVVDGHKGRVIELKGIQFIAKAAKTLPRLSKEAAEEQAKTEESKVETAGDA